MLKCIQKPPIDDYIMDTVRILKLSDKTCVLHDVCYCFQIICLKYGFGSGLDFVIRLPWDFLCNMSNAFNTVMVVIFYELESMMIMDIPDLGWCP